MHCVTFLATLTDTSSTLLVLFIGLQLEAESSYFSFVLNVLYPIISVSF